MESSFADFLFDPFAKGMDGMAVGFLKVVQRMVADAAAAQILGGLMGTKKGDGGGLLGMAFSAVAGAAVGAFGGGSKGVSVANGNSSSLSNSSLTNNYTWKNANGNAFGGGSIIPFASGGVFDKPTNFPMTGGRTGLLGEAGPEAIMPLMRGPGGKLGIMAIGGGNAGDVQISTQVTVSGGKNNDDSNMAALGGLINARIREVIMTEKRPNGLLA
jgi:phage-related minor tail protein